MNASRLIVSYLAMRKLIGFVGFTFPLILLFGGFVSGVKIQSSVSYYYHTAMHDIFIAVLCIVAAFLFVYKGYEKKDEIAGKIASISALGVALLPTTIKINPTYTQEIIGMFHLMCASGYFLTIAYFCLCLFPKNNSSLMTQQKIKRNFVYKSSAYLILTCLICIVILSLQSDEFNQSLSYLNPVFWLESLAIMAFGFSWLVKGEAIMKDEINL